MREALFLGVLLLASPAGAVVVECPDGEVHFVDDPREVECVEICEDGSWVVTGEGVCPEVKAKADRLDLLQALGGGVLALATLILVGAVCIVAYLLPAVIAFRRNHHQRMAIFALNLLLGWSVIGWVGSLVWALTETKGGE